MINNIEELYTENCKTTTRNKGIVKEINNESSNNSRSNNNIDIAENCAN